MVLKRFVLLIAICLAIGGLVINQLNSETVTVIINGNVLIVASVICMIFIILYAMHTSC